MGLYKKSWIFRVTQKRDTHTLTLKFIGVEKKQILQGL